MGDVTVEDAPPVEQPTEPPQTPDKADKLYDNLIQSGFTDKNLGSKDEFKQALKNPIKANTIYSGLRSSGFTESNLGTMKEFQTSFGYTDPDSKPVPVPHDSLGGIQDLQPKPPALVPITDPELKAKNQAIQTAQQGWRDVTSKPVPTPAAGKQDKRSISDQVQQALYLPAFNQGFNELVTKPLAGATDFVDRTINKTYHAVTGEEAPSWLRKGGTFDGLVKTYDEAYQNRDKPKNLASDVVEGAVGTMPLMAAMFTGEGEVSLATKAPNFFSQATKVLATTGAANAYKDATDEGKGYTSSLLDAQKGGIEGAKQGMMIDAQMLLGGAFGKGVVSKLEGYGLKGNKASDAILHSLATATVFGGTPAAQDLLQGKPIDTHEAAKQFGMGLMFELPMVAKGIGEHVEGKFINHDAAKLAAASTAVSNMNAESTLRTLINTPAEQLQEIAKIPGSHDDLYAHSIEQGAKAYEAEDLAEKNHYYANQMLLKTQADVKQIASKVADPASRTELLDSISNSTELPDEQKTDLINKINALTPTENEKANDDAEKNVGNQENNSQNANEGVNQKEVSNEITKTSGETHQEEDGIAGQQVENKPTDISQSQESLGQRGEHEEPQGLLNEEPNISVKEVLDKPIRYNGEPAELSQDGQQVIAKVKGTNREYELGNIDEVGDKSIKDLGIEHEKSVVDTHENGNIVVRGKEYVNNYSDPKSAINYDKGGNIVSVNLETTDGAKRAFKGNVAEDIAYQIHLNELNKNNESKQQFEQFVEQHEPSKSAIVAGENAIAAEKGTVENNASISRKPARKVKEITNATKTGNQSENNQQKHQGIDGQQQGVEADRNDQENNVTGGKTEAGNSNSVEQGGEIKPEAKVSETPKIEAAKQRLQDAKAKLKALNLGIAHDPEERAKALFEYHGALVGVAKEYIKQGVTDIAKFAKEIGEKVNDRLQKAWDEANGGKKATEADFHETPEAIYGTKNAITEDLQKGLGLPPIEIPKDRSDDASLQAWKDGKRTPQEIVEQLLSPGDIYDKSITPNDEPIMREYIRQLGERGRELNKIKADLLEKGDEADVASVSQQIDRHLDEYNNALNASKVGGNIWHKYGDERQKAIDDKGLIVNAIDRIKNIYGNDIPPEVTAQLKDLQAKYDLLEAKNTQLEKRIKDQAATASIPKKRTIFGTKRLSDTEFKAKTDDIVEKMRLDFKKSFGQLNSTVPGIPQFNAIAPHVSALVRVLADRGITKLDDVIDAVHERIKDIADFTKDDVRDLIAGRYSEKKPLSDLTKEVNSIRTQSRLLAKIADLEKGIKQAVRSKGEASPEVKKLQERVAKLKKQTPNEFANISADDLAQRAKQIQKQIDKGDFFKMPTVKRTWENDPKWQENNRQKAKLMQELKELERDAQNSKKGKYMRTLDWVNRWGRRVIFFGANAVYTKLASAAVLGSFVHRPIEFGLGKINNAMFPNIAKGAPIEGYLNAESEAKFYTEFLNPKKFVKNTIDIAKTGETDLSRELGRHKASNHIPIVDLFAADAHIMIKDPVKRATFEASLINYLKFYERNGIDGTHPMMLESARQAAYKRAEYEIFQNSDPNGSKIKRFFNELEKSGIVNKQMPDKFSRIKGDAQYTAAQLYHFFIPVNTVPVNILKRIGLGPMLPFKYVEAAVKNRDIKNGLLHMSGEESDLLMLQLKKGQISAAYWTLGFILGGSAAGGLYTKFYSDKDRDKTADTPDSNYLNGIPKDIQHNTQFQALQMGATWRIVHDHYVEDKDYGSVMAHMIAAASVAGAAAQQHPVISAASNIKEAITTPQGNEKFNKDLKRRIGVNKATDLLKLMGYGDLSDDDEK